MASKPITFQLWQKSAYIFPTLSRKLTFFNSFFFCLVSVLNLGVWEFFPPFVMTLCQAQWWDLGLWEKFPQPQIPPLHCVWHRVITNGGENSHTPRFNTDTRQKKRVEKCQFSGKSWKNVRAFLSELKSYWFWGQTTVRLFFFDQSWKKLHFWSELKIC